MNGTQYYRLGVDVGGTFTDLVLLGSNGQVVIKKVPSNKDGYHEAILAGVEQLLSETGVSASSITEVSHAATVGTNAIIQRQGAVTGLITTKGFRDVLELRRLRRPNPDPLWDKPEPLVPRRLRLEVNERMSAHGEVLIPLDTAEVRRAADTLVSRGVSSAAVCLLNAPFNPAHEQTIADILRREYPSLEVSVSTEVFSAIREYERTSTTVINAYVRPVVATYVNAFREGLTEMGIGAPLLVMGSSGGMLTSRVASQRPAMVLESGPAAGVIAAAYLARQLGLSDLAVMDMGGTTTKAAMIENGEPLLAPEHEVGGDVSQGSQLWQGGGYHLLGRCIDLAEIGAGGGSIVSVDIGGALKVGPRSAGARPGPISYGLGGEEPTITDANVLLGYLNPEYLLGGAMAVDLEGTQRLFKQKVADPMGLSLDDAAHGVHLVANSEMARAMGTVTMARGRDIRDMALCIFGGGGPAHATGLADIMGIKRIIVPPSPGLFSAVGLLCSKREIEFVQAFWRDLSDMDASTLEVSFRDLEGRALSEFQVEGFDPTEVQFVRSVDAKYVDQVHELMVSLPGVAENSEMLAAIAEAFAVEHEQRYGHRSAEEPIQLVNLRVIGRLKSEDGASSLSLSLFGDSLYSVGKKKGNRIAYFGKTLGRVDTPIVSRSDLSEHPVRGPLIIEEYDTTIVVTPNFQASRDTLWNVIIEPA